jgi:hypothetical protein
LQPVRSPWAIKDGRIAAVRSAGWPVRWCWSLGNGDYAIKNNKDKEAREFSRPLQHREQLLLNIAKDGHPTLKINSRLKGGHICVEV